VTSSIGRNYARALFELASETSTRESVEEDVRSARDCLFADREVRAFLSNRLISRVTKKSIVRSGLEGKVDGRLLILLFLLVNRGRTAMLGEICEEFERLCRLSRGVRKVTVYSAFPLGEPEKKSIIRSLESRFGARVELETGIRQSLIGGVIAESEGQEIEFSVEGQLKTLVARLEGK
jgi:F-type H+-transporting ATPase subunit delta